MSDRSRSRATGRLFVKGRLLQGPSPLPPKSLPRAVGNFPTQRGDPLRKHTKSIVTDSLVNQSGHRRHGCPQGKHRQDPPCWQPEASPSPAPGDHRGSSFHGGRTRGLAHTYWGLKLQAFFLKLRVYLMGKNHREIKTPAGVSWARPHSWETPRPAGVAQQRRTRAFPLSTKPACHNDTCHRSTPQVHDTPQVHATPQVQATPQVHDTHGQPPATDGRHSGMESRARTR